MVRHTITHADELFVGAAYYAPANGSKRGVRFTPLVQVDLGTPVVEDPDGVAVSQAVAGAGNLTLVSSTVTLDVPRNITIDSDNVANTTQTATITGTDQYGEALVETLTFNGTTEVVGKKAFKTVTQIAISAAITGNAFAGYGRALGLPYRVDEAGLVMAFFDSTLDLTASAVLGTFLPAATAAATATTGDVRGTYAPVGTMNGTANVRALIKIADIATKVGSFGVAQFGG